MIGIDEAGYGPNLGPLCVAATAWHVVEKPGDRGQETGNERRHGGQVLAPTATSIAPPVDLYTRLADIVASQPSDHRIAIADSKVLYKPGKGLSHLERGVLSSLANVIGRPATSWQALIETTGADHNGHRLALPWHDNFNTMLPIDADPQVLLDLTARFTTACGFSDIKLHDVQARLVFPHELNRLTEHHGTKGAALSHVSIGLLREMMDRLAESVGVDSTWLTALTESIYVTCDKHGGRNRYGALLQHHFPDDWIETIDESRPASRYQWGPPEARVQVCFRTKGEAELPTALASMTAKYHRELAMRALNAFWQQHLPDLKPTAGYPVDARRFKADIAAVQCQLRIDDADLWRNR